MAAVRHISASPSPLTQSTSTPFVEPLSPISFASYSTPACPTPFSHLDSHSATPLNNTRDDDEYDNMENLRDDADSNEDEVAVIDEACGETILRNVEIVMGILREYRGDIPRMRTGLDGCGLAITGDVVSEVLSRIRNDWEAAFTFFLWAADQSPGYLHSVREYHSMISILAKWRKFDTAWSLIDEMRGGGDGLRLRIITPHTLMIMIRRGCLLEE